jgi:hypothetical protein
MIRQIIELPSVRTVHLYIDYLDNRPHHHDFDFPFVEALTLEGYALYRFPEYFRPSYPMLRSLTVMATFDDDMKAGTFIAAFPTIEEVVLNSKRVSISLLLHRLESTRKPHWPQLRTLTIVDSYGTECTPSSDKSRVFLCNIIDLP